MCQKVAACRIPKLVTHMWPAGHGLNITMLYHFSLVATLNSTDGSVTVDSKMV